MKCQCVFPLQLNSLKYKDKIEDINNCNKDRFALPDIKCYHVIKNKIMQL